MRRVLLIIAFAVPVFLLLILLVPHGGASRDISFGEVENIRKIDLTLSDLQHVMNIAAAVVNGRDYEKNTQDHRMVYHPSARGVFVSVLRPKERAKTAFGFGDTLEEAVVRAGELLVRVAQKDDPARLRLRVDIINSTTDGKEKMMGKIWRYDFAHKGLIFNTQPIAAILPQEVVGFDVINRKGRYLASGMKRLVKERVLGRVIREKFQEESEAEFVEFDAQSFIQDKNGGIRLLYGMNYHDLPPTEGNVLRAVIAGGEYLKANINLETGRFNYRYYPERNADSKSYNHLRHAGTVYSMMEVFEVTGDEGMLDAVRAGIGWMRDNIDGPNEADKARGVDFSALVNKKLKEAKTGAAALAVLAFAKHAEVTGDRQYLPLMRGLGRFILFNIDEDGKLAGKYYYGEGQHKPFDSNFYPGECALALVRLNRIDPDEKWIEGAVRIIEYQRLTRDAGKTSANIFHDNWLCRALAELDPPSAKPEFTDYAFTIGDAIVAKQLTGGPRLDAIGGFSRRPTSTPTATRNEAMVALLSLARSAGDEDRERRYWKAAVLAAQLQLRMQYNEVSAMFFSAPHKAYGGFMAGYAKPRIQIESVQHNISSLLGVWREHVRRSGREPKELYGKVLEKFSLERCPRVLEETPAAKSFAPAA